MSSLENKEVAMTTSEMKKWLHSLNLQQLLNAMKFTFPQSSSSSSSSYSSSSSLSSRPSSSSCHEYDLLLEMLRNQSPPPTPIHPRAMGYKKLASKQPLTNGRWDEEERILRNRFERPRLFQFIERSSPSSKSNRTATNTYGGGGGGGMEDLLLGGVDIASLGLPSEIAELVHAEKKMLSSKSHHDSNNNNHHHPKGKKQQSKKGNNNSRYFDVLAKKFVQPWGDVSSLGCTERQRIADAHIILGTRIHYGCATRTPSTKNNDIPSNEYYIQFNHNVNVRIGTLSFVKKYETVLDVLTMLRVVSRGRFLSIPYDHKRYDDNIDQISFCAPWFEPTNEWFSLPVYLASRYEVALWHSFHLSKNNKHQSDVIEKIPTTLIERHYQFMTRELFCHSVLKSIHMTLKKDLLGELSYLMKDYHISDLSLLSLLKVGISSCHGGSLNLETLISTPLIHVGSPNDKFRLKLVHYLEDVLSEEAGKTLIDSYPQGSETMTQKVKPSKRTTRKKKKNRRRQVHVTSSGPANHLKAIDEDQDEGAKGKDFNETPPNYVVNAIESTTLNNDKMFILEIVDSILVGAFKEIGFESYDDDDIDDFSNKVKCHDVVDVPHHRSGESYVLKKDLKQPVKQKTQKEAEVNNISDTLAYNQMTMKRSNRTWDKAVSQPMLSSQQYVNDFFRPNNLEESELSPSLLPQEQMNSSKVSINSTNMFQYQHHNYIEDYTTHHNYCLDSAFDRIEKNIINDLLESEQRFCEENFASSTAASIASSILDLENEQVSNDDLSEVSNSVEEAQHAATPLSHELETYTNETSNEESNTILKDETELAMDINNDSVSLEGSLPESPEQEPPLTPDRESSTKSPTSQEPNTPPPQLSPILVTLAELGEFRRRSQRDVDEKMDSCQDNFPPVPLSSVPSSPKFPKRSWSREDLRISMTKDDSHDFRGEPSLKSYKNAALKGFRKTPSISSHDIRDIEANVKKKRHSESIRFARSVSSLKSFAKEVIIDTSIQLNMCAQSESALDDHEDSSHWNVIPFAGLDETDNATQDGGTTISSFPSIQETEEITGLREERNAYRDMCLTLGSEIAKLKNLLATQYSNNSFPQMTSNSNLLESMSGTLSTFDPEHIPPFFQNRYKGLLDGKFTARSDAGIHHDTLMSVDGTEVIHGSVTATDASVKHRTVNSSSIGNMRLSSLSEGRAGSDVASIDYDAARSVFNPPTSTCFFRRDSFGPAHLHGLQSRLGQEISNFLSTVSSQLEKRCNTRELARKRLTTLVTTIWPRAQVKIYGSHVTGLCLPSSDLDFVICLPAVHKNTPADTPGDLEGRNAINETNQKLLARKLKSESWIDPRSIKIIERTIVPVIKVATKDIKSRSLQLDISFDSQDHHGLDAIDMVNDTISNYPMVRPLVLVIKQFLLDKGLLTAYTGGLSSYCVFLMVTKYLQEHPLGWTDSGVYLMGFLDFYGNHFDPRSTGISVRKKQYFARPNYPQRQDNSTNSWTSAREKDRVLGTIVAEDDSQMVSQRHSIISSIRNQSQPFTFDPLFVEDPISHGNNVGRNSFRINQVQRTFSDAHRALVASLEWDMNSAEDFGRSHLLKCLIQGYDLDL